MRANITGIAQQTTHTIYQLSSPSFSTKAALKSLEKFLEQSQQNGPLAEKAQGKKS